MALCLPGFALSQKVAGQLGKKRQMVGFTADYTEFINCCVEGEGTF